MNIEPPSGGLHLPFVRHRPNHGKGEKRLPGLEWMPNKVRNHLIASIGEFCGTFLFLFFAFSATQVANAATNNSGGADSGSLTQVANTSVLLYISLAFGFSLAVNAWVFFRITGGLFNPAVTLGMCLIGGVKWVRGGLVIVAQLLGSMAASGVVQALYPGPMNVSTTLGAGTSIVRGLFIEMFATAMLVFTIFMLAAEKHKGTFLAPIGIGLALFICELATVFFTGGSLNPARSFGPCVVLHDFPGYHWLYWLGPAMGSVLAVGFYRFLRTLEYETAAPGQDFDEKETEAFAADEEPARAADVARPSAAAVERSEYFGSTNSGGTQTGNAQPPANYAPQPEQKSRGAVGAATNDGPTLLPQLHPEAAIKSSKPSTGRDHQSHASPVESRFDAAPDVEKGHPESANGGFRVSGL